MALLAVAAVFGFVSCKEKEPEVIPTTATITANDVTVDVGKTVSIGATTNSSAAITYACDNSAIATVSNAGEVTGVAKGTASITLKVAAVEGKFTAAEKTIKVTVNEELPPVPPAPTANINIDGDFSDWAELPEGSFSQTYGDEEATHPALTHCKVFANAEYVYVYIEWDTDQITSEPGVEHVPFHCYINTDGDESTGGFADQYSDACTDILLEGFLYDGGEEGGEMGSYAPGAFAWSGDPNGSGWSWDDLGAVVESDGAGVDGKYEFCLARASFDAFGFPIADTFSIGFDIQQSWNSVGILPNAAPSEENPSGTMPSLKVVTYK